MILLTIIALSIISIVITVGLTIILGGAGFVLIFGDVLICAAFIYFVVRTLLKK